MAVKRKKKRKRVADAADWAGYFESIRSVCPWSLPSYTKGGIAITHWQREAQPLGDLDARVYVHFVRPQRLRVLHNELNETTEWEWLWSHPEMGGHSAPLPCLIQQDAEQLERIRNRHKG